MIDRKQRIATHEAGHACIARVLRLPRCGGVSIVEPHAGAYFSLAHGAPSIIALMAGRAAELVTLGDYDRIGSSVDHERWTQRLELLGYDEEVLWDRTVALVRQHLGTIQWTAQHLLYQQRLDGRTIDRIVARG